MRLKDRILAFSNLGDWLMENIQFKKSENSFDTTHKEMNELVTQAHLNNNWFTTHNSLQALYYWAKQLQETSLTQWVNDFTFSKTPKSVAVIMAGNIPLVGFHDVLSTLISGHKVIVKLSSKDSILIPFLLQKLIEYNPEFKELISITDNKLANFDAVIATGSNNSARYFEYYFKNKKALIRKNRNSVAVLTGNESPEQLQLLAHDIFDYFGLGCRNVSKVFIPENFELDLLFNALYSHHKIVDHHKYANNYDYNKAVYLMSEIPILDNGFVVLKKDIHMTSPVATLFYETYKNLTQIQNYIETNIDSIQCVVSKGVYKNEIPFGKTQSPHLNDYADGINTLQFLSEIN